MMKHVLLAAVVAGLSGCGSSAEPSYYALAARPGQSMAGAPRQLEVRRPALAGYLDRAEIVHRVVDYKLKVQTGERWAEPLGDMVGRVLAQDLASRLPESTVFLESGSISAIPDAIVGIDVLRFDEDANGTVHLEAQIAVETTGNAKVTKARRIALDAKPDGGDTAALVGTMSALLGTLSDTVAQMLRDQGKLNPG